MRFEPHPYQRRAIDFVKAKRRCALFLDMGLGKTVSTLTAVAELMDEAEVTHTLVVAPKKVAESTWSAEASKWDHLRGLTVSLVAGTERQRRAALEREADIYVMSRDSVVWFAQNYGLRSKPHIDCVVLDELTSFKNHRAKRFRAVRSIITSRAVPYVVGLTGTPAPNSLIDLWAQIHCIDGGERLGKFIGKYREAYFSAVPIGRVATKYVPRPGAEEAIPAKIGDICLTMQAKDYLSLPDRIEVTDRIELGDQLLRKYRSFERDMVLEYKRGMEEGTIVADSAAGLMNKLAQFANGAVYGEDRKVAEIHGEKIERLKEIIEAAECPVLVFYQFQHDRDRIMEAVKGTRAYTGDGDLAEWNRGGIPVLLAHPASTAYGLNMQAGGHVAVWFGTGWNLEHYLQANARLHRQGQTHPVTIHRLVCAGTADEAALSAIDRKCGTQEGIIETLKQLLNRY